MPRIPDRQLAAMLYAQGWRQPDLETAVRIVLGESGGNPKALLVNGDGSRDRGLFQINSKAWPKVSDETAFDPQGAIRAAWQIYKLQKGFRPGRSAWWGPTRFHTRKRSGDGFVPDTSRIVRARTAAAAVAGIGGGSALASGSSSGKGKMPGWTLPALLIGFVALARSA